MSDVTLFYEMKIPSEIKQSVLSLTDAGKYAEALAALGPYINGNECDEAWFLRGNIYRKQENWQEAMDSYSKAMELNPESPAKDAYNMIVDILSFYDTQRYNV